ncbi:MAG TPA: hypothetical protein VJ385_09820 [Fibrobacteria bacterium]|nr:hypothetical protein [Fibrobacteria bacterium]
MDSKGISSWIGKKASFLAAAAIVCSCEQQGTGPVTLPEIPCEDPSVLALPRFSVTPHKHPVRVAGKDTAFAGTQWAKGDSVRAFFGNKAVKLVFTLNKSMYLLTYAEGEALVTRISHDDEGVNGAVGSINSPLFSPDGRKILFAGTTRGKPAFILDAVPGPAPAWRVPVDPKARVTADPHWHVEGGKTYIYFATLPGLVNYSDRCGQISGATYRAQMLSDTSLDSIRVTGIPGAYRGGISKDGLWTGTSYASSALYDLSSKTTRLLAGGEQQCNPSMNPYPAGSKHNDYMMILAFGGRPAYKMIDGTEFVEGLHENLWIYNKDDKVVWRAKRPDEDVYLRYDKPEWSTHPDYASAVALRKDTEDGDLYVIRIGDLANAEEGKLNQAQGYLRIGKGGFTSDSYSHLWVEP